MYDTCIYVCVCVCVNPLNLVRAPSTRASRFDVGRFEIGFRGNVFPRKTRADGGRHVR